MPYYVTVILRNSLTDRQVGPTVNATCASASREAIMEAAKQAAHCLAVPEKD